LVSKKAGKKVTPQYIIGQWEHLSDLLVGASLTSLVRLFLVAPSEKARASALARCEQE
jgi:hypothetical protein